jgi:hypothetical protein
MWDRNRQHCVEVEAGARKKGQAKTPEPAPTLHLSNISAP